MKATELAILKQALKIAENYEEEYGFVAYDAGLCLEQFIKVVEAE